MLSEAKRISMAAWHVKNKEHVAAYKRAWYLANRDQAAAGSKARYAANPEKFKARIKANQMAKPEQTAANHRAKRAKNPEKYSALLRAWRVANRERNAAGNAAWRAANPALVNAYSAARKGRKLHATPLWADAELMELIYAEAIHRGMHVDHIIPLQGKTVCGLHVYNNTQLLTPSQNFSKGNRWPVAVTTPKTNP